MKFQQTNLQGVILVSPERVEDERGFFARTLCRDEFSSQGLKHDFAQSSVSFNRKLGTLRGMHFQKAPNGESKLVRCTMGALYDVVIDLRPMSPTHAKWIGVELSAVNRNALYIPEGFAHGFLTLADDTEVLYQISVEYRHESAAGVRWNDPAFAIHWPALPAVLSDRDRNYPDYKP